MQRQERALPAQASSTCALKIDIRKLKRAVVRILDWQEFDESCHCCQSSWLVKEEIMNASTSSLSGREILNRATRIGFIAAVIFWIIVPDYTFANTPAPKVIVIPAQSEPSKAMLEWIRQSTKNTDVTMSVCTGAFVLAKTGLLSGKSATTFHAAFKTFAMQFPDIHLKRGVRFVEDGNLASAGGLSSGIDLALRVVERYYGREVAQKTAYNMEYQGQGWLNADSNNAYATALVSTPEHPVCAVCGMDVDPKIAAKSVYKGTTYYFCSDDDKKTFETAPEKFVDADKKL